MKRTTWFCLATVAAVALFAVSHNANASTITIGFEGLDFELADGDLVDTNSSGPDALDSVSIETGAIDITLTTGISAELVIPDIDDIPVGVVGVSETVSTGGGGSFTLNLPAGDFVSFDLDDITVTLVDVGNFQFNAVAAIADPGTVAQSLPFGIELFDPIDLVFSTFDVSDITSDGTNVIAFTANDAEGTITAAVVPEPTTALLTLMVAGTLAIRRRH